MVSILIIEDDPSVRQAMTRALNDRGHAVRSAGTAMAGLHEVVTGDPDVVLLDLSLPDLDINRVVPVIRAATKSPIIVLSAHDEDDVVIRSLDAGADDYVVKPISAEHFDARVRAVLRRSSETDAPTGTLTIGNLTIDQERRTATLNDDPLELSRREFDLLTYLALHAGRIVTKRDLLTNVWQQSYRGGERTVEVHLSWLRRKLGETAAEPVYLHSVRGVGVRLEAPTG